nr:hypothetical protein CFP56_06633 [Quercus suber]
MVPTDAATEEAKCEDLEKVVIGIDLFFICHHLNVNPSIIPKKQPSRRPSREHADVIREEVMKLKRVGAIKEVSFIPNGWPILWPPSDEFPSFLSGLSPNTVSIEGSGEDSLYDSHRELLF